MALLIVVISFGLPKILTSLGLLSNIVGVVLYVYTSRTIYANGSIQVDVDSHWKEKLAWMLQVAGFALQLFGNIILP